MLSIVALIFNLSRYNEEMLDKPRVVAKSVLTVKALFESQVFANLYESMQEFAFQTAEVTVCAIQGHNGWYWAGP